MFHFWNGSGWGAFWMILSMVAFWGLLVAVVVMLVRPGDRGEKTSPKPDAIELLRRRFAEGQISREEFEERLAVLDAAPH